jgi:hypothetical protein
MTSRLASFLALDPADRVLAVRAIGLTVLFRVALRVAPFPTVRAFADRRLARAPGRRAPERWPLAVRAAVKRAERTVPASTCLVLALVAEWLLRDGGHPCRLTVGVAPDGATALDAHAWVESGSCLVTGDGALERYRPLVAFSTPAR